MNGPGSSHIVVPLAVASILAGLAPTGAAREGEQAMQDRRIIEPASDAAPYSGALAAGGFVFVSAQTGIAAEGPADVAAQTTRALARVGALLEAAGSSLAQAVTVHVYLRRAADFEAMNGAYRLVFADKPPTRTTVVVPLPGAAVVAVAAVAVPNGVEREVLHPAGWIKSPRPYSYIVRANGFVFLSGLISRRGSDDAPVPGPIGTQVRTILDNAGVLLKTAGLTFADVVSSRVFLTDDTFYEPMNDEYRRYFGAEPPARATAIVELVGLEAAVEITLVATTAEKEIIGQTLAPSFPLSPAVRAGRFVFLSGVLGNTEQNLGDVAGQTRETMLRINRTLESAGLSFSDVVDSAVYLPDLSQQRRVDEVYREFFPGDAPARSAVGARLATRAGLVEIMMTAFK
jgi:enamine deaminase RidA (YjgF/YER057c/UK114 family)